MKKISSTSRKVKAAQFLNQQENFMAIVCLLSLFSYSLLYFITRNTVVLMVGYIGFYYLYSKLYRYFYNKLFRDVVNSTNRKGD